MMFLKTEKKALLIPECNDKTFLENTIVKWKPRFQINWRMTKIPYQKSIALSPCLAAIYLFCSYCLFSLACYFLAIVLTIVHDLNVAGTGKIGAKLQYGVVPTWSWGLEKKRLKR